MVKWQAGVSSRPGSMKRAGKPTAMHACWKIMAAWPHQPHLPRFARSNSATALQSRNVSGSGVVNFQRAANQCPSGGGPALNR